MSAFVDVIKYPPMEEEACSVLCVWATNLAFKMLITAKASSPLAHRGLPKSTRYMLALVHVNVFNLIRDYVHVSIKQMKPGFFS